MNRSAQGTPRVGAEERASAPERDGRLAERIGRRLRRRRLELGLTLAKVAELASISTSYLSAVEKGANLPSLPTLAKVTEALQTTIPDVVAQEGTNLVLRGHLPTPGEGTVRLSHPKLQLEVVALASRATGESPLPLPCKGRDVFGYVLEGELKVSIDGNEPIALFAGDALDLRAVCSVRLSTEKGSVSIWSSCPVRR